MASPETGDLRSSFFDGSSGTGMHQCLGNHGAMMSVHGLMLGNDNIIFSLLNFILVFYFRCWQKDTASMCKPQSLEMGNGKIALRLKSPEVL